MKRRPNLTGRAPATLVGVALLAALVGCTPSEPAPERTPAPPPVSTSERGPQPIVGWSNGGDIQVVHLPTCNGNPIAEVEETAETVTITVTSTLTSPGDMCQDYIRVQLKSDLGDRVVIDGSTGEPPPGIEG